jgi:hypothetical protein
MILTELKFFIGLARFQYFEEASTNSKISQSKQSIAVKKIESGLRINWLERLKNTRWVTLLGEKIIHHRSLPGITKI